MGGLLRLFDFNQSSMARKILTHKRHVGAGVEAPRNSLDLQIESPQSYCAVGDLPYRYEMEEDCSEKNCYPIEASMKKLINDEISKRSNPRHNAPGIVARLMGVEALPLDTKSVVQPIEKEHGCHGSKTSKRERNGRSSVAHCSSNSNFSRKMELDSVYHCNERDAVRWSTSQKLGKPRPREHPQEEELQKFKKDFEAWQAARLKECTKVVDIGNISAQSLGQENLKKEQVESYANSGKAVTLKPIEPKCLSVNSRLHERDGSQHHRYKMEFLPAEQKEIFHSRSRDACRDFQQSYLIDHDQELDAAPTRIVILKPGPDRICEYEDSCTSSSGTLEDRDNIEDFLEEVKERLKCELQGSNLKRCSAARGSGIETPFREKPSEPKQIARHIAKEVRDTVTRDLGMTLVRSESTRSYRSEFHVNGPDSPEFINRDTRRILSERLRNVLKRETYLDVPTVISDSRRPKHTQDNLKAVNEKVYWDITKNERDVQTRSFRHGDEGVVNRELSPRNLMRSLSAPVSGTSFGKLLLEDRHILTGAQIRRKHEAIESLSVDARKRKKEKFDFKKKVSNFRYSFTLRGRLFGKKIQSMMESHSFDHDCVKDIMSGPTVIMNFGRRHENSTEVPPSPASVCSSTQEEFWWPADHLSAISTPDGTIRDDNIGPQVFKEISSNLNELRRQLNELDSDLPEETTEQEAIESEMIAVDDQAEAYVRDLLVASSLYDSSADASLSRWDPFVKLISNSVFEEVEECHRKLAKKKESTTKDGNEKKMENKMLFDLLNEALAVVLGPSTGKSRLKRKIVGCSMLPPPHGRKLLDSVWNIIREYLYPPTERSYYSLDSMVARDLCITPWSGLVEEETVILGRDVESLIMGDLVNELVKDIHSFQCTDY